MAIRSRKRATVPLSPADRRAVEESLGEARSRGAASGDEGTSGLFEALESFGLSSDRVQRLRDSISNLEVRDSIEKAQDYLSEQIENARDYARENPKKVIGGAAGVLVGASLLALAIKRAGGESRRKAARSASASSSTAASSSSGSKKSTGGSKKRTSSKSSKKSAKRR